MLLAQRPNSLLCILLFSPKLLEKQPPPTEAKTEEENGDSQKMTAGKKRLENVKIVSKEKM